MPKPTHWTACTAQAENGSFCDEQSVPDAPFPICFRHGAQLYAFFRGRAEVADKDLYIDALEAMSYARSRQRAEPPQPDGVLYYVQIGEHIKIGVTTNLKARLASYPPTRRLLATEPGNERDEQDRLNQFAAALDLGREWFRPVPELIGHVNSLRRAAGASPIAVPDAAA